MLKRFLIVVNQNRNNHCNHQNKRQQHNERIKTRSKRRHEARENTCEQVTVCLLFWLDEKEAPLFSSHHTTHHRMCNT